MYTCKVFNDFSINPSYLMDFETQIEVDTFVSCVSKSPYFARVQITCLNSIIKLIEESNFMGHELQQILDTVNLARTQTRKKLLETVSIGSEVLYHYQETLLSGTVTEKFCDNFIIGETRAVDPLCIVHIETTYLI